MARARRQPATSQSEEFKCPECGRTFTRAAALGAHRRRAHGVVGATAQTRAKRGTRSRTSTAAKPATRTATASSTANGRRASRASASRLDRDALLRTVFPGGVPARESVIRAANAWLDEAERLARLK